MRVTGTSRLSRGQGIPIILGVNKRQLFADLRRSKPDAKGLFAGLPHSFKKLRGDYLVAPAIMFREDRIIFNVRAVRDRMRAEFQEVIAQGENATEYWLDSPEWREHRRKRWRTLFRYEYRRDYTPRDVWSFMILDWALSEESSEFVQAFFDGKMDLGEAFARYLGIFPERSFFSSVPGQEGLIRRHMIDPTKANTVIDLAVWVRMEEEHQARLKSMREIGPIYEGYARIWLFIFSIFTGSTPVFVLRVAAEAFMGYMDFMIELYKAEEDGIITPEESQGAWLALIGVFLPMGQFFGKVAEVVVGVVSLGILAVSIALALLNALIDVLLKIERSIAAEEAQLINYVEVNPDMAVYIPATI